MEQQQERNALLARKAVEEKAKECLAKGPNQQQGWLVSDLRAMLKWKMPTNEYNTQKVSSATRDTLIQLWESYRDVDVPDIIIPAAVDQPSIPSLQETKVGRAAERHAKLHSLVQTNFQMKSLKVW